MPGRICISCGDIFDMRTSKGQRCPACQQGADRQRDQRRGTPAARGYDAAHTRRAKTVVDAANRDGTPCCYCGRPPGTPGPSARTDDDPFVGCHVHAQSRGGAADGPLAAGHRSCNNAAAGRLNRKR